MSNLQLIEELCCVVERQIKLISKLSSRLVELGGLSEAEKETIADIEAAYAKAIDADEYLYPFEFETGSC